MTVQLKNTILQEFVKAGVLVIVLSTGLYFFYEDNKRHQTNVEKRLDKVESRLDECNDKNVEILQDQVNKSNQLLKSIKELIENSTNEQ